LLTCTPQNDNKALTDERARNRLALDEKYSTVLAKLEEQQAAKDAPQQNVVDIDTEELFVLAPTPCRSGLASNLPWHRFRGRFKSLIEQYELRELHFHSQMRTKELEVQYNLARFEREKKAVDAEKNRLKRQDMQIQTFTKTETELRQQLNVYVEKFKQVRPVPCFSAPSPKTLPALTRSGTTCNPHDPPSCHKRSTKASRASSNKNGDMSRLRTPSTIATSCF
jgi:hypothetical protein